MSGKIKALIQIHPEGCWVKELVKDEVTIPTEPITALIVKISSETYYYPSEDSGWGWNLFSDDGDFTIIMMKE